MQKKGKATDMVHADGDWYLKQGTMHAPMLRDGHTPATYWQYVIDGRRFFVPNYGFHARITDFDFVVGCRPCFRSFRTLFFIWDLFSTPSLLFVLFFFSFLASFSGTSFCLFCHHFVVFGPFS